MLTAFANDVQDFEVKDPLPNISFPLPRSYAGSISTKTVDHPNNTAFFWGFEKSDGSLARSSSNPWGVWLAGGPGFSSIAALLLENGPIAVNKTGFVPRNTSMHQLADWVSPGSLRPLTCYSCRSSSGLIRLSALGIPQSAKADMLQTKTK
jgi:hypothetical protein